MTEMFCGIDFGTTNSTVGLCARDGQPALAPLEDDAVTIPSALFFSFEDRVKPEDDAVGVGGCRPYSAACLQSSFLKSDAAGCSLRGQCLRYWATRWNTTSSPVLALPPNRYLAPAESIKR